MNKTFETAAFNETRETVIPDLSFVIPAYNEAENIAETLRRVSACAQELVEFAEILVVDDGSRDATIEITQKVDIATPVRILRLSRNFGKEQAIMAGLERANGAAVVIVDADLQEPLHHVKTMLDHHKNGYEMVYAVRAHREDELYLKRLFTKVFYKWVSYGGDFEIPSDARDFRLMDRRVVDALCSLPERNRFMKGLYGWVGFKSIAVPIELEERTGGKSKFGFRGLLKLGITGLTSFTNWPLRIWTGIGTVIALFSIIYGLWILSRTLLWGADVAGWATLVVAVFFIGGVQLISIGIIGEYLARVFTEVKGRPGYLIAEELKGENS